MLYLDFKPEGYYDVSWFDYSDAFYSLGWVRIVTLYLYSLGN